MAASSRAQSEEWPMTDSPDFHALNSQAEELLGKLGNIQSEEAKALRDRVSDAFTTAKSAISDVSDGATDAFRNAMVSADDYVHENPWIAVGVVAGIAGAVGFLAGMVAAPKKRFFWS
jgi:ElaB/YqjD/DUF883 family membrane-anchored ribosome-binding protein